MRILLVAATRPEVAPLVAHLRQPIAHNRVLTGELGSHNVDVLLTGVGMVATAVWTSRALAIGGYDAALNLGVCGSFTPSLPLTTVLHVSSDVVSELGAEDGTRFLSLQEMGLLNPDAFPYTGGRFVNTEPPALPTLDQLPTVAGITVNTVHGDTASIAAVVERYAPDVESMEGAAFMFACLAAGVPFAQIRAVSNRVERRNRDGWDLKGAIDELTRVSLQLLGSSLP